MLFFRIASQLAFCGACLLCDVVALGADYVVVVSKATQSDSEWSKVVEELVAKHQAEVVVYDNHVSESLPALRKTFPRYACFVATSAEASIQTVADVHRLTRKLDDDPYADMFWGILTGYNAANALEIAKEREPAWNAKLAPGKLSYEQSLTEVSSGVFALEIKPRLGEKSFEPVNQNGSERGWRPIVHFFPNRVKDIEIITGKELSPVITDNFVLIPNPKICDPNKTYRVEFKATLVAPRRSPR